MPIRFAILSNLSASARNLTAGLRKAAATDPAPCWTEYLRATANR